MKYICFDFGNKRTGVAISTKGSGLSFPRDIIIKDTRAGFFDKIALLFVEEKPGAVVIGLPKYLNGDESLTTRQVLNFAASLKRRHDLSIYLMDEMYSSFEAEDRLKLAGIKHNDMQDGRLDSASAVVILDSFLVLSSAQQADRLFVSAE